MIDRPVAGSPPSSESVADLIKCLVKALRAVQLYLPNNPVYRQALRSARQAFAPVFEELTAVELEVGDTTLQWDEQVVYQEEDRAESLAWMLFKDGVRWIRFAPGVEDEEILTLLDVLNRARQLSSDDEDDLLTLMWESDFQFVTYRFVEPGDGVPPLGPEQRATPPHPADVQAVVDKTLADPEPHAVVDLSDFDASLYVLDAHEEDYLRREIEREYRQDVRANLLSALLDMFELQTQAAVRSEIIQVIEGLLPVFLADLDYKSVALVLRELQVVVARADTLLAGHKKDLENLPERLSKPDVFEQLLRALDAADPPPSEEELGAFFGALRPEAINVAVRWLERLKDPRIRSLLDAAVQRVARAHPKAMSSTLKVRDTESLLSAVRLVKWLRIGTVAAELTELLEHEELPVRVEAVNALGEIGTPKCMDALEVALSDPAREVRIAAVRAFGNRRDRRVLPRIRSFMEGRRARNSDTTERLAFYEAYGQIGGKAVIDELAGVLLQRGFMRREDPDTRASAAMGIARIGTEEARTVLERAENEKDPVVRSAVRRALQEMDRRR